MAIARKLTPIDEARTIYNQYQTLKDLKLENQSTLNHLQKTLDELRRRNENLLLITILYACTFDKTDPYKTLLIEAPITNTFKEYCCDPSSSISLEEITIDDIELLSQHPPSIYREVPPVLSALKDHIKTLEERSLILLPQILYNTLRSIPPPLFHLIMSYASKQERTVNFYSSLLVRSNPAEEKETPPFIFTCQLTIQRTRHNIWVDSFYNQEVTFTITRDNRIYYQINHEEKEINRKTLRSDFFACRLGYQLATHNWPSVKELFSLTLQQFQNLRNIPRILIHLGKLGNQNAREGLNKDFSRLHQIGVFRIDPVFHFIANPSRFFDKVDEIEANKVIAKVSCIKEDQRGCYFFRKYSPKMISNIQEIIEELKMLPPKVREKLYQEARLPSFFRAQIQNHLRNPIYELWRKTCYNTPLRNEADQLEELTRAAYSL